MKIRRSEVRVIPLWEVRCDVLPCEGENADMGQIYDTRAEAVEARIDHIRMHEEGLM